MTESDRDDKERPEHTGTTLGGHVSHTGGCWVMLLTAIALLVFLFIRYC